MSIVFAVILGVIGGAVAVGTIVYMSVQIAVAKGLGW